MAAAACAFIASKAPSDELHGAYRDSARELLNVSATSFDGPDPRGPRGIPKPFRTAPACDERASGARVARKRLPGRRLAPAASVGEQAGGPTEFALITDARSALGRAGVRGISDDSRHDEVLITPLGSDGRVDAALVARYDLRPAHADLADRNRDVAIVLGILLACFSVFTMFVLGRGIFRPLDRLRVATRSVGGGDLGTRLRWRRRDELGELSRDFDGMAADLEEHNKRLEELAHRDPLTGLANHRHFQEMLGQGSIAPRARPGRHGGADRHRRLQAHQRVAQPPIRRRVAARLQPASARRCATWASSLASAGTSSGSSCPTPRAVAFALAEACRGAVEAAGAVSGSLRLFRRPGLLPGRRAPRPAPLLQLASGALMWARRVAAGVRAATTPENVFVVTDEQREQFARMIGQEDVVRPVFQPIVSLATASRSVTRRWRFAGKPGLPPSWWFSQAHRFRAGRVARGRHRPAGARSRARPGDASCRST